jgi:hypothetical protein
MSNETLVQYCPLRLGYSSIWTQPFTELINTYSLSMDSGLNKPLVLLKIFIFRGAKKSLTRLIFSSYHHAAHIVVFV